MSQTITVYVDGACKGNPGLGGWGAYIITEQAEHKICGGEPETTNNRMELTAVLKALKYMAKFGYVAATIVTDSMYVKNGLEKWIVGWKNNGWKASTGSPVKNKDLWVEIDNLRQQFDLNFQWVKGHSGNKYNDAVDKLASDACLV